VKLNVVTTYLGLATVLASSGCVKIKHAEKVGIEQAPGGPGGLAGPIDIDCQASYVEVASDGGKPLPGARYDRVEMLSAGETHETT
jgi:hypothetical protein